MLVLTNTRLSTTYLFLCRNRNVYVPAVYPVLIWLITHFPENCLVSRNAHFQTNFHDYPPSSNSLFWREKRLTSFEPGLMWRSAHLQWPVVIKRSTLRQPVLYQETFTFPQLVLISNNAHLLWTLLMSKWPSCSDLLSSNANLPATCSNSKNCPVPFRNLFQCLKKSTFQQLVFILSRKQCPLPTRFFFFFLSKSVHLPTRCFYVKNCPSSNKIFWCQKVPSSNKTFLCPEVSTFQQDVFLCPEVSTFQQDVFMSRSVHLSTRCFYAQKCLPSNKTFLCPEVFTFQQDVFMPRSVHLSTRSFYAQKCSPFNKTFLCPEVFTFQQDAFMSRSVHLSTRCFYVQRCSPFNKVFSAFYVKKWPPSNKMFLYYEMFSSQKMFLSRSVHLPPVCVFVSVPPPNSKLCFVFKEMDQQQRNQSWYWDIDRCMDITATSAFWCYSDPFISSDLSVVKTASVNVTSILLFLLSRVASAPPYHRTFLSPHWPNCSEVRAESLPLITPRS